MTNEYIESIKAKLRPYKYTYKGKSIILESTSGNYVIKDCNNNLKDLFTYLDSRNFHNHPIVVDNKDNNYLFSYLDDITIPKEQKLNDLIELIADLHRKTVYFKEVSEDKFQSVYENIKNNILYLKEYYDKLFDTGFNEIYPSPSTYLFLRNYTKINSTLIFCESELDNWYQLVKDNKTKRVCLLHNNLELDHLLKNNLISWDNYTIDTPILDIINLYKKEYYLTDFGPLLKKYLSIFELLEEEKKLLFIMLSLPWSLNLDKNEMENCKNINNLIDYIYKTENLIRPYYTEKQKEK